MKPGPANSDGRVYALEIFASTGTSLNCANARIFSSAKYIGVIFDFECSKNARQSTQPTKVEIKASYGEVENVVDSNAQETTGVKEIESLEEKNYS